MEGNKSIFISHATKDKVIATAFIDLILHGALEIPLKNIFCTSTEGTNIKSGEDWRKAIKSKLESASITFLIITPNYKESEMCLNEMGAAWVLSAKVLPTIVDPIDFVTVGVIHQVTQVKKLLEPLHLDNLRDSIQESFETPYSAIDSARWTIKKIEFLDAIKNHLQKYPFHKPLDRSSFEQAINESRELHEAITEMVKNNSHLKQQIKELEGIKDAATVRSIKQKFNPSTEFEEFNKMCKDIAASLKKFHAYIRGVFYKDFNEKAQSSDWISYRLQIEEAAAENYIILDEDTMVFHVDHDTTDDVEELYSKLYTLSRFLEGDRGSDFLEQYRSNFKAPPSLTNISFWQEAFNVSVFLN